MFVMVLFVSLVNSLSGQSCPAQASARVLAPNGLIFREAPGLQSAVLAKVPFDSVVRICLSKEYGKLRVEGREGYWRYAEWREFRGYLYDGYLELTSLSAKASGRGEASEARAGDLALAPEPQREEGKEQDESELRPLDVQPFFKGSTLRFLTEAYNYCGSVESLDPGLQWYGVFLNEEGENYQIKPVELRIQLSAQKLSDSMEFDILTDKPERSVFLFGHDRQVPVEVLKIKQRESDFEAINHRVFPGQSFQLKSIPKVELSATGTVLRTGDCPQMENYRLWLTVGKGSRQRQQDLTALLPAPGLCGLPDIYWVGDLGGDGVPEIVLVQQYEKRVVFSLLSSRGRTADVLMHLDSQFTQSDCF